VLSGAERTVGPGLGAADGRVLDEIRDLDAVDLEPENG